MVQTTPQKRTYVEAQGSALGTKPLGSGLFRLRAYSPGQELLLERNPLFWNNQRPLLDTIRIRLAMPRESMLLSFLQGDIDLLDARICEDALLIAREPLWAPYVERAPLYVATADLFNNKKPPFSDKRVRQAFNYAINRGDSARLSNGRVIPANGFLPPQMLGYKKDRPVWPQDREKAKLLLAEAGYDHGLEVTYTTLRDEMAQKIALSMRDDLEKIGVRMNIETLTFPAYLASLSRGDLTFAFSSWTMDFPDPWDFLEVKFHSRMIAAGTNDTGYQNAEVDRLLDLARLELDEEKRGALYQKAEDIIVEDCPNLWHYFSMSVDVRQPWVQGRIRHPARDLFFRDTWVAGR
jgi:ABC-type transport system substrate-binding protein